MRASPRYYVEVSTLLDSSWSGIANVTSNICRILLERGERVEFFAFDKILKKSFVVNALRTSDGLGLRLLFEYGHAVSQDLRNREMTSTREVAIFPNFKRDYQSFDYEVLIVHDLSFILTPELHEPHLVKGYVSRLFQDAQSVDRVVCVSHATHRDLTRYYHVPAEKVIVSHLGVDSSNANVDASTSEIVDAERLAHLLLTPQKYFLVLGTIEPRKNIGLIIDYIMCDPRILSSYKFVFAGRNGWGKSLQDLCFERHVADSRIIHLGYVSERDRLMLLNNAAALIFPSWFEGFGLPVLEAMRLGVPVIGSQSSSIVEAGGPDMIAFDPGSVESISGAIEKFRSLSADDLIELKGRCQQHASQFTWGNFVERILRSVAESSHSAEEDFELSPTFQSQSLDA